MAQRTFAETLAAVTANCRRSDDSGLITRKIQDAVKMILNKYNYPLLEVIGAVSTVASQSYTAFPTNFKELYSEKSVTSGVSGESDYLIVWSPGQFIEKHPKPDEDTEAMPRECMFFEDRINWWPIPDDVYSIILHYFKYDTVFSASVPHNLGEPADRGIECIATALVYESFQEYQDSAYWYSVGWDDLRKYKRRNDDMDGRAVIVSGSLYSNTGTGGSVSGDKTDYGRIK